MGFVSLRHRVQTGSESHPASYPMGTGVLSAGVNWPGREADHSPQCSAEIKNAWSYTSILRIRLHSVALSYAQGQLYILPLISAENVK